MEQSYKITIEGGYVHDQMLERGLRQILRKQRSDNAHRIACRTLLDKYRHEYDKIRDDYFAREPIPTVTVMQV